MGVLTLATILAANDLKRETVAVPEWGGDVLVQELSATHREEVFALTHGKTDIERGRVFRRAILARALVDENGAPMFSDAEGLNVAAPIDSLMAKSAAVVDRLAEVALKLSGLGQSAEGDAKNA